MTKYEPLHEWVKEAKLKGAMAQIADSATDHIGRVIDNTTMKDYVYLSCFVAATWLIYNSAANVPLAFNNLYTAVTSGTTWDFLTMNIYDYQAKYGTKSLEGLDVTLLATAMVGAYGLLKLDITDIATAVTKVRGAIG